MGIYKTSQTVPLWGDEPAEILCEAFRRIKEHFKMLDFELTDVDLVFGCFCALVDQMNTVRPTWDRREKIQNPPSPGEKEE